MTTSRRMPAMMASSVLLTGATCGHGQPPERPAAGCEPMPTEGYEHVRAMPRLPATAYGKLDYDLQMIVRVMEQRVFGPGEEPVPEELLPRGCVPASVDVALTIRGGDVAPLEASGFHVSSIIGGVDRPQSFLTGRVSPSRIVDLLLLPNVLEVIGGSAPLHPELDDTTEFAKVKALRAQRPDADGTGVLVAIIDSGIDWRHGTFSRANGRTRIVAIWDMEIQHLENIETPGPDGVGVQYSAHDIDYGLGHLPPPGQPVVVVRHRDRKGEDDADAHGTLVAGIAVGNGKPAACCRPGGGVYIGVAPEAEILAIRLRPWMPEATSMEKALAYIGTYASTHNLPVVVNVSNGLALGPHDGTSRWERAIEEWLTIGSKTRVFVKSAGNDATAGRHVETTIVAAGTADIPLVLANGQTGVVLMEFWISGASTLEFEILHQDDTVIRHAQPAVSGTSGFPAPGGGLVQLSWKLSADNFNNHRSVQVRIIAPSRGSIAQGEWGIKVHNVGPASVGLDGWIDRGGKTTFKKPGASGSGLRATSSGTITTPGTNKSVITVAAHSLPGLISSMDLSETSSRGPVRNEPPDNPKPTLTAPGVKVTSAEANAGTRWPDWCCPDWTDTKGTGTSMAAPHVAGAVAIMLQKNPTLPLTEVHRILRESAQGGDRGNPNAWGAGHLDVQRAWDLTPLPESPLVIAPTTLGTDAAPGASAGAPAFERAHPFVALARRAATDDNAAICAALMSRHFSEVRRLVNTNRRVATLWHRADGPAMLRRLALPSGPPALPSATSRAYFERMLGQLQRYGSPVLRAIVVRYGATVVDVLAAGREPMPRDPVRVAPTRPRIFNRAAAAPAMI